MDDFRRKPIERVSMPPVQPSPVTTPPLQPLPTSQPQPLSPQIPTPPKRSRKKVIAWSIAGVLSALVLGMVGLVAWYNTQLSPVDSKNIDKKLVTIELGSTPETIANRLRDDGLIRNPTAFIWHARVQGVQNKLQAGTYRLSPSESTQAIIEHLTSGKVDTFSIRFLPGATVADNRKALIDAGYSAEEVDAALLKTYDIPLFTSKPASADIEGYIYGETYSFATDTPVETILMRVFSEMAKVVDDNNLKALYEERNLSVYQGVTLASIVQREASPGGEDMAQIAGVFYNRLKLGMPLGSDVTYQYIADKTGVARDINLDSPYNTRRYTGLPPGPIASPGKKALIAAANPVDSEYLYFLSGDDDITYFGRTLQEHEANIANHCQKKCQIL